ncbi:hypothetical protein P154DRAFT_305512 [Amniculicola lignicola CBS 123094]|uniref:Uncharacterized protein n=1 Tax=Amniculicola lignicola CBS 123094 TaxID=1392246 RepID=A0A6A5W7P2_9PLEO|nr:hypothetical protein P154DRAFT_305512 [Amniculicola lignicola CBS 123094]
MHDRGLGRCFSKHHHWLLGTCSSFYNGVPRTTKEGSMNLNRTSKSKLLFHTQCAHIAPLGFILLIERQHRCNAQHPPDSASDAPSYTSSKGAFGPHTSSPEPNGIFANLNMFCVIGQDPCCNQVLLINHTFGQHRLPRSAPRFAWLQQMALHQSCCLGPSLQGLRKVKHRQAFVCPTCSGRITLYLVQSPKRRKNLGAWLCIL